MKKNQGFTLIELLGVIIIVGILSVVALPQIINQMGRSREEVSSATLEVLYAAGEVYLDKNQSMYHQVGGNVFCIPLKELTDAGELDAPILDATGGEEIPLSKVLKYTVEDRTGIPVINFEKKLYNANECTMVNE